MTRALFISLIAAVLFVLWLQPFDLGRNEVTIPRGANGYEVSELLARCRIVRSRNEFLFWLRLSGREQNLKYGTYTLPRFKNPLYLIQKLTSGVRADMLVTIPEGLSIAQTAAILESEGLVIADDFIRLCGDAIFIRTLGFDVPSLEGYLFPDSYFFSPTQNDSQIIRTMCRNFLDRTERLAALTRDSLHKVVTLASLVELEAKYNDERPVIAAVFLNRLRLRRPLESCATVIYVLEKMAPGSQVTCLKESDLKTESPYNTYIHSGLPPGPICSPGENSLRAVTEPADVDFLYFVSRGDGRHHFSRTFKEHLIAREQYRAQE
jgi:UPF0755 protein